MRFYFEPDEATRVAKCLGLAYISHSAFFVTVDAASMHFVLRVSKLYILTKSFIDPHHTLLHFTLVLPLLELTYQHKSPQHKHTIHQTTRTRITVLACTDTKKEHAQVSLHTLFSVLGQYHLRSNDA